MEKKVLCSTENRSAIVPTLKVGVHHGDNQHHFQRMKVARKELMSKGMGGMKKK